MSPDLPTCPRKDCTATIDHWHHSTASDRTAVAMACPKLYGEECYDHEDPDRRCYAPRTPQPQPKPAAVALPTVDEVMSECYVNRKAARAVLDLLAARLPVWQPVEPGTVIKAGTRVRNEWATGGDASEWDLSTDITFGDPPNVRRMWLDPRTVPAEPEDPAVAAVLEWLTICGPIDAGTDDARDLLARIDAARADA